MKCVTKYLFLVFGLFVFVANGQAGQLKPYTDDPNPPPIKLKDLSGKLRKLSDYRGQVVLVNFWATWCPPCRAEMPSMWRLKNKLKHKPITVMAVDMGETAKEVNAFLPDKMKQDFVVLLDIKGVALKKWKVFAFPSSYVIDTKGKIRYALYGALEWDAPEVIAVFNKLLAEKD